MKRSQLKALIKECIVEVLTDGVGEELLESRSRTPRRQVRRAKPAQRRFDPRLDTPVTNGHNEILEEKIRDVAGGDDIMSEILRDTAANTLPQQEAASGRSRSALTGDYAARVVDAAEPDDLFDGAGNWAQLAFGE